MRGHYVRALRHERLVFLAGHGPPPGPDGTRPRGRVGAEYTLEEGYAHARGAGLALLASLATELGGVDGLARIERVLRVFGMVNVAPGFDATPAVIDGCSDLLVSVLGVEIGSHVRSAIGVAELPYGLPVEIEAVVAVRD